MDKREEVPLLTTDDVKQLIESNTSYSTGSNGIGSAAVSTIRFDTIALTLNAHVDSRVQAALAPLRKELARLHQPVCKESGELAVNGVCPIHKGDGCLFASGWVEANRALRDMGRKRDAELTELHAGCGETFQCANGKTHTSRRGKDGVNPCLYCQLESAEQQLAACIKAVAPSVMATPETLSGHIAGIHKAMVEEAEERDKLAKQLAEQPTIWKQNARDNLKHADEEAAKRQAAESRLTSLREGLRHIVDLAMLSSSRPIDTLRKMRDEAETLLAEKKES